MKVTSKTFTVNFNCEKPVRIEALTSSILKFSSEFNLPLNTIDFSLTTTESFFTEVTIDEIVALFNENQSKADMLSISLSSNVQTILLDFFIGAQMPIQTGSIRILNATDDLEQSISDYFINTLQLHKIIVPSADDIYKGYLVINPVFSNRNFGGSWDSVFVLMPFSLSWSETVWEGFKSFGLANTLKIRRADDLYGHDVIEDIWRGILDSVCVIADVTSVNLNVFYELGIAHTLGRQIILISQDVESIPDVFKKFRTVKYTIDTGGLDKLFKELLPLVKECYQPKT